MTSQPVTLEEIDRDKTSTHRSVRVESTAGMSVSSSNAFGTSGLETQSEALLKSTMSSGLAGLETQSEALLKSAMSSGLAGLTTTWSEGTDTVSWDSQSHLFSSDPVTTTYNEPMTDQVSTATQAEITGTSDSLVADTTTNDELTTETTGAFVVSEVENPSQEGSDSSLQATVSEDIATSPRPISGRTAETSLVATMISESQAPSEGANMTTRRTIEITSRTLNTTDAPTTAHHALLSTSEAATTLPTSDTRDTVSTASEVAPTGSGYGTVNSPLSQGALIGCVVGATVAVIVLVLIFVILVIIFRRKRRMSCYITDHDLKDYRSLMKRPHEAPAMVSPSVVQPISPFNDMFPEDVANNRPPVSKYRMVNFDKNSDDGLDGIELVLDDSRDQRSPKEIPIQEYTLTPSGYSDCSYSVNTFRPDERKSENKSTDLVKSDAETKLGADETSENDEKAIEE